MRQSDDEEYAPNKDDCGDKIVANSDDQSIDEWYEMYTCPLTVRFTQEKIHPFFYRRGPIVNVLPLIRPVLRRANDGSNETVVELAPPFSPIHCVKKGEELWSLDNRRLYALQLAAMEMWPQPCRIGVLCRDRLSRHKLKSQYRKFNTTSEGRAINVCARFRKFDRWNWFERATELETYTYSRRLGALLLFFEVLPGFAAVLFRTGLTGLSSRTPLVVAFVMAFIIDLVRQKVPSLERFVSEHHVRAIMNEEVCDWSPEWRSLSQTVQRVVLGEELETGPMSALQISVATALAMLLLLPYLAGLRADRIRSYLLSVWLGVMCVVVIQLSDDLRRAVAARMLDASGGGSGHEAIERNEEDENAGAENNEERDYELREETEKVNTLDNCISDGGMPAPMMT